MSSNEKNENGKICFLCHPKEDQSKYCIIDPSTKQTCEFEWTWQCECDCPICGHYFLDEDAFKLLQQTDNPSFFEKARAIAAMRKLQGRDNYTLSLGSDYSSIMIGDNNFLDEYPSNFPERIGKILWNIGKLTDFDPLESCIIDRNNLQYLFCSRNSLANLLEFMAKEEFINYAKGKGYIRLNLTLKGYNSIQRNDSNDQCFIAMWFDDYMQSYRKAIKKAIDNAGYQSRIADEELHNEQIMPKVFNLIKNSRFVIADLTSFNTDIRGGVYYEAGYAKGLGLPVILTCQKDAQSRIHFDLKQTMCYFWSDEGGILKLQDQDFVDVITQNILLNVGPGPRKKNNLE